MRKHLREGVIGLARALAAAAALAVFALPASAQEDPLVPQTPVSEQDEEQASTDVVVPTRTTHELTKADVDAWLDGYMPYAIEDLDIVGAVVAVVKDGELLTSKGYGYADLAARKPMDPAATLVRPGSISKLFTWTAIMQLVEQGKVNLDDDVNKYLDFKIPDAFGAPVTIRNVLTHTPGFEEVIKNLIIKDPAKLMGLGEYLKAHVPARAFPPGTTPAYSNYATALAGYIVERVSGMSFDDYIEKNIFEPLGMQHSTFRQPLPEKFSGGMSNGYKNVFDNKPQAYELVVPAPAGSLAATADDMARFMIAHLANGGALLKPETAQAMHGTIDQHTPPLNAMALGFYQQNVRGLRSVGHGGDSNYFHSDLHLFLDKGVGIFVSVNSEGNNGLGTLTIREKLTAKFAERYFTEAQGDLPERLATAREHGALVAGVYESSRSPVKNFLAVIRLTGQMKITQDAEGDLITPLGSAKWHWREVEPFVWQRADSHDRLSVTRSDDGKVKSVTFEPLSPFTIYTPPPAYRSSAILMPLFLAALGVLGLTFVLWPVRAVVRWRHKAKFSLTGKSAMAYRLARISAAVVLGYIAAWGFFIATAMSELANVTAALDPTVRMLQIAQILLYLSAAAALWNMLQNWSERRSWFALLWSTVLPLAIGIVIWFAAVAGWLSFHLNY